MGRGGGHSTRGARSRSRRCPTGERSFVPARARLAPDSLEDGAFRALQLGPMRSRHWEVIGASPRSTRTTERACPHSSAHSIVSRRCVGALGITPRTPIADPNRVDRPVRLTRVETYMLGLMIVRHPRYGIFCLTIAPRPWHERGTAATLPRTVSGFWLAGWVVGRNGRQGVGIGGKDESPPSSTRSAMRGDCQAAALPFASSCAMPFSIARIWFTKSSRIAPFCIESGNGTEILSVAVAS